MALFSLALRPSFLVPQPQFRDEFHPSPFLQASPVPQAGSQGVSCRVPSGSSPPCMHAPLVSSVRPVLRCQAWHHRSPSPMCSEGEVRTGTEWQWCSSAGGAALVLCHCLLQEQPEVGACPGKRPPVSRGDCGLLSRQPVLSSSRTHPARIRTGPALDTTQCSESINRYIWKSLPFVSHFLCDFADAFLIRMLCNC